MFLPSLSPFREKKTARFFNPISLEIFLLAIY
jgi:hypothetical protein